MFSFSFRAQHGDPNTRDAQLRRRSSWSDLSSFFKFNRGGARNVDETQSEAGASPVDGCSTKTVRFIKHNAFVALPSLVL